MFSWLLWNRCYFHEFDMIFCDVTCCFFQVYFVNDVSPWFHVMYWFHVVFDIIIKSCQQSKMKSLWHQKEISKSNSFGCRAVFCSEQVSQHYGSVKNRQKLLSFTKLGRFWARRLLLLGRMVEFVVNSRPQSSSLTQSVWPRVAAFLLISTVNHLQV